MKTEFSSYIPTPDNFLSSLRKTNKTLNISYQKIIQVEIKMCCN